MKTDIVLPMQINNSLRSRNNGVLGEKRRGSMENQAFGARIWKKLSEKRRNLKPGVAFSVLTRDFDKELEVRLHRSLKNRLF